MDFWDLFPLVPKLLLGNAVRETLFHLRWTRVKEQEAGDSRECVPKLELGNEGSVDTR